MLPPFDLSPGESSNLSKKPSVLLVSLFIKVQVKSARAHRGCNDYSWVLMQRLVSMFKMCTYYDTIVYYPVGFIDRHTKHYPS